MTSRGFLYLITALCVGFLLFPPAAQGQESEENISFNMTGGLKITGAPIGQGVEVPSPITFVYTAPVENIVFSVSPVPPVHCSEGYEEIPDVGWVKLDRTEIVAEPGALENVWITLDIPNDERYLGKNWEVWINVDPQAENQLWGLGGYCRLWISTTATPPPPIWPITLAIVVVGGIIGVLAYLIRKGKI